MPPRVGVMLWSDIRLSVCLSGQSALCTGACGCRHRVRLASATGLPEHVEVAVKISSHAYRVAVVGPTSVPASVVPAAAAHGQLTACRFSRQCTWHDLIVARVSWSAGYCYTRRGVVCHGLLRPMAYSYAPSKVLPITGDARIVSC